MLTLTYMLLSFAPLALAALAYAVLVPCLVAWHVRRATSPLDAPATPGWALALDAALDDAAALQDVDAGWTEPGLVVEEWRAPAPLLQPSPLAVVRRIRPVRPVVGTGFALFRCRRGMQRPFRKPSLHASCHAKHEVSGPSASGVPPS